MPRSKGTQKTGGRKAGTPNKLTAGDKREIAERVREFLSSPAYLASASARVLAGVAPHLEREWHHYGWGKPIETVHADHSGHVTFGWADQSS